MASLTTINVGQNIHKKWSYKRMKEFMRYLSTYNTASLGLRIDGASGSPDIDTVTTTVLGFFNGQPVQVAKDDAMDISNDTTEVSLTAWVTATAYSVGNIREDQYGTRFRCTTAHTSSIDDEPHKGDRWAENWEYAPHGAVNASGSVIQDDYDQWFMVTAQVDGTLNVWEAGDEAAIGTAECKIPQFDHKLYVCIGFMHVSNQTGADFTMGDTDLDDATEDNITTTFLQQVGPVFPHQDNWDAN